MTHSFSIYHVDSFAENIFSGNPAAVVPLANWPPDKVLAAIAAENNLPETAFLVPLPQSGGADYDLRWFTPTFEIDLCGHATLAAAWVAFHELGFAGARVRFTSRSGPLAVERRGELLVMDFPAWPPKPVPVTEVMRRAFGAAPLEAAAGRDLLCVFADEDTVRGLKPDPAAVAELPYVCDIASARGRAGGAFDFVSRVFCPEPGMLEDPVTGSAHSLLTPFWAGRLGKTKLEAWQASERGGRLICELSGARVRIAGRVAPYLRGTINI